MKQTAIALVAALLLVAPTCFAKKKLQQGDKAPNFKLQDETGAWRTLEEFRGQKIVLYFYPKDDTANCTKQACSFRDNIGVYAEKGIVVLGVNYDSPESHKAFKEKYRLPFTLLSDTTTKVAQEYGAYSKVPLLNRYFPKRRTYLINEHGTVVRRLKNVEVATHAEDILKEFEAAQ
jgi:thioredoxin-dependent peroxiredoxin